MKKVDRPKSRLESGISSIKLSTKKLIAEKRMKSAYRYVDEHGSFLIEGFRAFVTFKGTFAGVNAKMAV